MSDPLSDVLASLEVADNAASDATAKAKRTQRERKPPETLEESRERILAMKLNDAERQIVLDVFKWLTDGHVQRSPDASKKLSKKEVFELYAFEQQRIRERKRKLVVETRPSNYWIVTDVETLREVDRLLWDEDEIAADTETTGLDIYNDRIVGYSMYLPKADIAFYVPFGHTTGQVQVAESDARMVAAVHFARPNLRTIWHHYKYDGHLLDTTWGIRVANVWWDTQPASKLLNEHEPSHRLKDLHAKYCGNGEAILFEDLFDDHVIYDKDIVLSGIYAAGDAHKTYLLYKFQKPHIDTVGNLKTVWYEIEQPLLQVDLDMERTGFRIDVDRMRALEELYTPQLREAEQSIIQAFNIDAEFEQRMADHFGKPVETFNINSNAHLGYLLYDVLGCDPLIGKTKFKKSERSTASDVLDYLTDEYENLAPLKRYRQLFKLISTYLHKLPLAIEPATGRLHCRFNNLGGDDSGEGGTATGRYSSSFYVRGRDSRTGDHDKGTNMQNLASKGEGIEVRRCFVPDDGWVFIGADESQIEPRIISVILAEWYGDKSMQQFYLDGRDLYTEMAMFTFGFEREYCVDGAYDPSHTFSPRKLLKQGVLSYLYGTSAKSFARTMKVDDEVAQTFFNGMIEAFPGLKQFREDVIKMLLTRGNTAYAETMFGRKRRFPNYRREHAELQQLNRIPRFKMTDAQQKRRNELWRNCASAERQALNAIIQGTAADVLKQCMIRMHRFVRDNGYQLNASIHDELLISVPKLNLTPQLIETINDIMTQTVTFSTPLKTDIVIMERWMDETRPSDWDFERQCPKEVA